ncbi:MAG: DNA alkylation repair protein [Pseudomonadales bacterium]|nr:DNA alkylation repair protein [Pseudomonadales bacterium]
MRRYFPHGINCIGATAADINRIVTSFKAENSGLSANEVLSVSETVLKHAQYSEEVFIAYGLIGHLVKKHFDDDLLLRFQYWLEHYACNWAHVDDLCIKAIYNFLMARPHLIEATQVWSYSDVPWCRRASNVVWVKFIKRKIGKSVYTLDTNLVFENCDQLMLDEDEFVQKSVGWLLKVTAVHHQQDVIEYLKRNINIIQRSTLRYALEKVDVDTRKSILSYSEMSRKS